MSGLLDLVTQSLGGANSERIGQQLGLSPEQTRGAIGAALPMLLAGLARNASQPDGASALHGALARDHDGTVLDDLSTLLQGGATSRATNGAGILGHVLGGRQQAAQQAVAGAGGIDGAKAAQLMAMLAPLVMGALGRTQRQSGLDAGGLSALLGGVQHEQMRAQPDLMSMANRLLDRDGDGSAVDDIVQGLGSLFGKR